MGQIFVTEQTTLRLHTKQKGRHDMAEILPIRHKTLFNQSINQTKQKVKNTLQPFFKREHKKLKSLLGKNRQTLVT